MKNLKNIRCFGTLLCLTFMLSGCSGSSGTEKAESLDIDYVNAAGEVTEETVAAEDESVLKRLTQKLSSDKEDAGRQTELPEGSRTEEKESGIQAIYSEGSSSPEEKKNTAQKNHDDAGKSKDASGQDSSEKDDFENGEEVSDGEEEDDRESKSTATITIRCDTAVANGMHEEARWTGIVPANGCILPVTEMELEEDDTVFSLLCRVRDKYKLQMEYDGSGGNEYIEGINNLYEFDGGRWSGWMYCVNDWYPNYGCGQYLLSDGDVIEWNYTCDLGLDLDGAAWEGAEDWKKTHE